MTEGFVFWRANVLKAAGPLAVAAAAGTAASQVDGKRALLVLAVNFLALVMAQGALYRVALADVGEGRKGPRGPLGFQWGWLEWRLAAVVILLFLLLAFVAAVLIFVLVVALLGIAGGDAALSATSPDELMAGLSPAARLAFNSGAFLAFLALLVLSMRLLMAAPATVAAGRLQFLSSLGLTRGNVVRLGLTVLLVNVPIFALQGVAWLAGQAPAAPTLLPWIDGATTALTPPIFIPISVGMTAYVYQRLREGADQ